jgi:hypothetical protein
MIGQTIRRLARLPRHHRIAHLKAVISTLPARSIRRQELEEYLRDEVTKQIKAEIRAA